jgi:hypothetical protein
VGGSGPEAKKEPGPNLFFGYFVDVACGVFELPSPRTEKKSVCGFCRAFFGKNFRYDCFTKSFFSTSRSKAIVLYLIVNCTGVNRFLFSSFESVRAKPIYGGVK